MGLLLFEPLLHRRIVYVVIIEPSFITGIVGWINEDAFDTIRVVRK